jgi:hypothetical protein
MSSPSLLHSIPPSVFITSCRGPSAATLTCRSVLVRGTGKKSTAMYHDHSYDQTDSPSPLPKKSTTWSHFTSVAQSPYSLSRCLSFPLSPFGGSRQYESPVGRRNNLVSYPATSDHTTAKPTVSLTSSSQRPTSFAPTDSASADNTQSPRQASPDHITEAGLPSRNTMEAPPGYISFASLGTSYDPPRSRTSTRHPVTILTADESEKASAMETPKSRRRRPRQSTQRH